MITVGTRGSSSPAVRFSSDVYMYVYVYVCVCCMPYALPTTNVLLYDFSQAECCEEAIEAHGIP